MLAAAIAGVRRDLRSRADPDRAAAMSAYMRNRFPFAGVPTPARRQATREFIAAGAGASPGDLLDAADALWAEPERECQYVAVDLLRRWVAELDAASLPRIERLIRTTSWWDTVDALAADVVGPLVRANPALSTLIDDWVDDDDIWIARTAILHQLRAGADTDTDRLFGAVERRAGDAEFFIRKACGWALREYAKHDPTAVRAFVERHRDVLSGLTVREATKHL